MSDLFNKFRMIHNQGFLPIFVDDALDSRLLVEACAEAGYSAIEYTLRRRDAHLMLPWIRQNFPELNLLVGSTIDDDKIVRQARERRYPQLLTLDELRAIGVDGFVSMHGFSDQTIQKFSRTHLLIPAASTLTEALRQFAAGAHIIKMLGPQLDLVRLCRSKATFDYCPIMLTGGISLGKIHTAVKAGAVIIGAGFDLMLNDLAVNKPTKKEVVKRLIQFRVTMQEAVDKIYPDYALNRESTGQKWLNHLPHQHHFIDGNDSNLNRTS